MCANSFLTSLVARTDVWSARAHVRTDTHTQISHSHTHTLTKLSLFFIYFVLSFAGTPTQFVILQVADKVTSCAVGPGGPVNLGLSPE